MFKRQLPKVTTGTGDDQQSDPEISPDQPAEAKMIWYNRELLAIQHTGATLASTWDSKDVLSTIAQEMINLLGLEGCYIAEWDQTAGTLVSMAHYGSETWWQERPVARVYRLRDFPLMERVLVEKRAQQIEMSQADLDLTELNYLQEFKIKRLLLLPMKFQSQVVGLMALMDDRSKGLFSLEEIGLVQLLANQAASAIQSDRLYYQARRELAERRQAEKELRQATIRNQAMLDAMPDSIFYFDRNGQLLDYRLVKRGDMSPGVMAPAITASDIHHIFPPDVAGVTLQNIHLALDSGQIQLFEYQLSLPAGPQDFEVRLVASNSHEVLAVVRNITQRKQVEEALKKSEANLKTILDNSHQTFLLIDNSGKIQVFNKLASEGIRQTLGKEIKQGDSIYDLIPPERFEIYNRTLQTALQGESIRLELDIKVNQQVHWFEINYSPVLTKNNEVIGVCISTVNIDERKRVLDTLAASEARLLSEMQSVLVITRALVSEVDVTNLLEFIIVQAEHLMNVDGAAVLLLSQDGQQLEVATPGKAWLSIQPGTQLPVRGSLAELALSSQRVQFTNQVQDDGRALPIQALLQPTPAQSLLCAPLIAQSKQLGILLLWSQQEQVFSPHDTHLMGLFADQAALALYSARLHARNQQLAVEQERHRLARELHDSVTQSLYSIGLAAQASLRILDQNVDSRVFEAIEHIHTLTQASLTEMREQLYHLHPTVLDEDLAKALTRHCQLLSKQYALDIELQTKLDTSISDSQQDVLYYITREALWNVVKHAQATRVQVTLTSQDDGTNLSIVDNGLGFDAVTLGMGETMGLRNILKAPLKSSQRLGRARKLW
jgi:PAS domain S-box-containing protein